MSSSAAELFEATTRKDKPVNESYILFILAAVQFTHIMDFVIMMPLNPVFQEVLHIDNRLFGVLVATYAASAGVSGFITFFFIDRLDRRTALLWLYTGFILATAGCAVAENYTFFLIARSAAGAFGGVLGALVLAIVGDVFPEERRGRATGIIMASFSFASVIGIPAGIFFAGAINWHFPFYMIAGLALIILFIAIRNFPSLTGHRTEKKTGSLNMLKEVFQSANTMWVLGFGSCLMLSGFSITPYLSDFFVSNQGFDQNALMYIYIIGGAVTVVTSPFIGRLSDKLGKRKVFVAVALVSIIPIVIITSLPPVPKYTVYLVSATFFIFFGGRFVPAMAMITSSVEKSKRGGFMSLNNAIQQLAAALAALIGGLLIGEKVNGMVAGFWVVGAFSVVMTIGCIVIARKVKQIS